MNPNKIARLRIGALSGFIVVLITTIINLTGRFIGLLPEAMDLRFMAGSLIDQKVYPTGALILGIIVHILIGVITGIVYLYIVKSINTGTGTIFMLVFWLLNMLMGMPLAGRGLFGLNDGVIIPIATLILHIVFGIGMGLIAKKILLNRVKI